MAVASLRPASKSPVGRAAKYNFVDIVFRVGLAFALAAVGVGCTSSDESPSTEPTVTADSANDDSESQTTTAGLSNPGEQEQSDTESTSSLPAAMRVGENPGVDIGSNWIGRNSMDETQVELVWSEVSEATSYQVHRFVVGVDPETVVLDQTNLVYRGTELQHNDQTVDSDTFYIYILVVDVDGEPSTRRWTEALTVTDTTPPAPITGLTGQRAGGSIELNWDPSSDDVEFASYSVALIGEDGTSRYIGGGTEPARSSFIDDQPPTGGAIYEVIAVDFHNNRTDPVRIEVD